MTYIDPAEQLAWDNQRRAARNTYQGSLVNLDFQRGAAQQNQGLDFNKLTTQFDQMRNNLPGGFAKRGLLNSGIYGDKLQQYGTARSSAFSDLASKYQQMLGGLGQQQNAAGINYSNTLGGVDDQEAIRRSQIAAALKGLA